jgi:hypothetical protein
MRIVKYLNKCTSSAITAENKKGPDSYEFRASWIRDFQERR